MNVGKPESDRDWVTGMAQPRLQGRERRGGEIEVDGKCKYFNAFLNYVKFQSKNSKVKNHTNTKSGLCKKCKKREANAVTGMSWLEFVKLS